MNEQLKQRVIGIIILVIFLAIAIPFFLSGSTKKSSNGKINQITLNIPTLKKQPVIQFSTPDGKTLDTKLTSSEQLTVKSKAMLGKNNVQNKSAESDQAPVFRHQSQPQTKVVNIAKNANIQTKPRNNKEEAANKNQVVNSADKENEKLQKSITQQEAKITNISTNIYHNNPHKILTNKHKHKKKKLISIRAESDLQRVLNEETKQMHITNKKIKHKIHSNKSTNHSIDRDI